MNSVRVDDWMAELAIIASNVTVVDPKTLFPLLDVYNIIRVKFFSRKRKRRSRFILRLVKLQLCNSCFPSFDVVSLLIYSASERFKVKKCNN